MEDGPVVDPEQKITVEQLIVAQYPGWCARNMEHSIEVGDVIGFIPEYGWSCESCVQ